MELSYGTGNEIVDRIGKMNFSGNVIPDMWFKTIRNAENKPFMNAILILSDIVYWYRPSEVRDELSGSVTSFKTKFSGDMLNRGYSQFEERFGLTKKQSRFALQYLEELGVIRREFRIIEKNGRLYNNIQFIEIIPEVLEKLTYPDEEDYKDLIPKPDSVLFQNVKSSDDTLVPLTELDPSTADGTTPGTADGTTPGSPEGTYTNTIYTKTKDTKIDSSTASNKNLNTTGRTPNKNKFSSKDIQEAKTIFPGVGESDIKALLKEAKGDIECLKRVRTIFDSRTEYIRNPVGWLISAIKDDYSDHSSGPIILPEASKNKVPDIGRNEDYSDEVIKNLLLKSAE